jgi:hypothetical protein
LTRKSLCREIESINQRLNSRQAQFQLTNEQSTLAIQKLSPYLIIGVGLLAGVVTGEMGWRKAYALAGVGFSFYPFLISRLAPDEYV